MGFLDKTTCHFEALFLEGIDKLNGDFLRKAFW